MHRLTASLTAVVRDALDAHGYLTTSGDLTRTAARRTNLSRTTIGRHLTTAALTAAELKQLATLVGKTTRELVTLAENRIAP